MKTLSDFYRLFPSHPATLGQARPALAPTTAVRPANDDVAIAESTPRYRARDYGTGYGRSSGYAHDRSYTAGFGDRMLRVG